MQNRVHAWRILKIRNTCQFMKLLFQLLTWFYWGQYVRGRNIHALSTTVNRERAGSLWPTEKASARTTTLGKKKKEKSKRTKGGRRKKYLKALPPFPVTTPKAGNSDGGFPAIYSCAVSLDLAVPSFEFLFSLLSLEQEPSAIMRGSCCPCLSYHPRSHLSCQDEPLETRVNLTL